MPSLLCYFGAIVTFVVGVGAFAYCIIGCGRFFLDGERDFQAWSGMIPGSAALLGWLILVIHMIAEALCGGL